MKVLCISKWAKAPSPIGGAAVYNQEHKRWLGYLGNDHDQGHVIVSGTGRAGTTFRYFRGKS
jgi:hypothetical protein